MRRVCWLGRRDPVPERAECPIGRAETLPPIDFSFTMLFSRSGFLIKGVESGCESG
jgi:hypothetical protein